MSESKVGEMAEQPYIFQLTIVKGTNLPRSSLLSKTNAYVKVCIGTRSDWKKCGVGGKT